MLLPGAQMSVQSPKFENDDFLLRLSVDPTVIAEGTYAGIQPQASMPAFIAATTTTTPALVAASTVSLTIWLVVLAPMLTLATAGRMELTASQSNAATNHDQAPGPSSLRILTPRTVAAGATP